ncbi:MAG: hypothetical protein BWK80_18505 [Desulfobacteraceae bacterium IS3]|nr:MAG: hypothetical protein BWK80_18505 [Desulfobacteraceae bacterium IS3]
MYERDYIVNELLKGARDYITSFYAALKYRELFKTIETYCMFIGYQKSGKTLTASLLDAHPNMVFADELGVLKYVYAGFSQKQIYALLLENSRAFTKTGRRDEADAFVVANQWQGRFGKLSVIGDNHGEAAVLRLRARPWLLGRLRKIMNVKIRVIHVVRNPYDNIAAMLKRRNLTIEEKSNYYFSLCETVTNIRQQLNSDELFEFRYESLIAEPERILKELCFFLGVDAREDYIKECVATIFKSPRKPRYDAKWDSESITTVKEKMSLFSFLKGYSYDD